MTLEEAMEAYREQFDDQYPLYCAQGMSESEIIEEIEECIRIGKPYEPEGGIAY